MSNVPDGPISDRTLDALRTTAAMVRAIPSLAAQIRIGDDIVLEVRRPPFPDVMHRTMPVCMFHRAVAGATRLRRSGDRIAMRGVPSECEPAIDWGIAGRGWILTSGITRIETDDRWWHFLPVAVDSDVVQATIGPREALSTVAQHPDPDVGVTILHVATAVGDDDAGDRAVDVLVDAVAAIGVADLEQRLSSAGPTRRTAVDAPLRDRRS